MSNLLDRLSRGEGLWTMAMTALALLVSLLAMGKFSGGEFVSAFSVWTTTVFGSAAIAGFRDWNKPKR